MRIWKPNGLVITFWLGADSKEKALTRCAELDIIDIESIKDETLTHPWREEK